MTLDEFLALEAVTPPYAGACCVMVDKWLEAQCGFSPLERYGRLVKTKEDVDAWLNEPGGIAVGVNRVMRRGGFAKTTEPQIGDVGLVFTVPATDGRIPLSMAILGANGWHSRNSRGLFMVPLANMWKAWHVN